MKQVTRYLILILLISIEINILSAQEYSLSLALKQDSLTVSTLNIKETIALSGQDTIIHNKYKQNGSLSYEMTRHFKENIKNRINFEKEAVWKRTEWLNNKNTIDTVSFNDGSILTAEYTPSKKPILQFHLSQDLLTVTPELNRLEPYVKSYTKFFYQFGTVDENGDTVQIKVESNHSKRSEYNIRIAKDYGICLDSLAYHKLFSFNSNNDSSYQSVFTKKSPKNNQIIYDKYTLFKHGNIYSITEKDLSQNEKIHFEFHLDSTPQAKYTLFDTCNTEIPKRKLFFTEGKLLKRIEYENYQAQWRATCLNWNAIHYNAAGKKIKKERFLRDDYYFYKDSLWFNINYPFKSFKRNLGSDWTCGGSSRNYYNKTKTTITVSDFYNVTDEIEFDTNAFSRFKKIIQNNFQYPPMYRDAQIQWTDTLLISSNRSLSKIYSVDVTHSFGKNRQSADFLLNEFKEYYPLQNLTEVVLILTDGTKKVITAQQDDSKITFKLNVIYRVRREG